MTVHSLCFESFEAFFNSDVDEWGVTVNCEKHNFSWTPCTFFRIPLLQSWILQVDAGVLIQSVADSFLRGIQAMNNCVLIHQNQKSYYWKFKKFMNLMTVSWLLGRLVCQSGIISKKKGREDTTLRSYIGGLLIFEPPLGGGGSQGSRGCIIVFIFLIIV